MANENTKIFSEAIAEAKAIRETAMVNAKLALEEAFTPRIQEMMNNKLSSLAEDEESEEDSHTSKGAAPGDQTDSMDEISLEELLAELEGLEETSGYEKNPEDKDTYMSNDGYEKPSSKKGVNDPYNMEENEIFEAEDEDTVAEITVEDLKDIVRNVVADLLGGPESEENDEGEGEPGHEEGETPEEEAGEHSKEDELSLEEILAELEEGEDAEEAENSLSMASNGELKEAMSTIATLRSELNEVNLLNSKLLYVNKLFKSKNLTEAQKVKVINAFDRAETVKESKNIYETLQESLTATSSTSNTKSQIKESLSFASKASGVADRKPIVENNDFVKRMQKLAGII